MEHLNTAAQAASAAGFAASAAAGTAKGAAVLGAGFGVAAGLATACVILMKKPRTEAEWFVSIVSTVFSSFAGGAAVILHFGLQRWVLVTDPIELFMGMIALIGVAFACGLPGWALVRWVFNTITKREGMDLPQVLNSIKTDKTEAKPE